ncbi:zinc-binding dehydrogenase [Enterococcus sp. DIV0876]|uniref:zinc-binding dehydrogenase n=1 Tax=Enterococcus sp. DIV0876 TaxID=2774633 RepID=UPI003D2FFB20
MDALYFNTFGDSNVLQFGTLPDPNIKDNELLIEMDYIGVNFADIYRREGRYTIQSHTPYINGYEGVGRVVAIGKDVTDFKMDARILFVDVPLANASLVAVPAEKAIIIPDEIDSKLAASVGLQGLTADFLVHDLGQSVAGEQVFVHGISGGVGQILSQMLTTDGADVTGITSTAKKRDLAMHQGAKHVYLRKDNWLPTNQGLFDTVYDGIGSTVTDSLALLKNKGKLIFYGMAGGNPPMIDLLPLLMHSKSILTGDLWDYLSSSEERNKRSERLFSYFINHQIKLSEPTIFALSEGKKAHELLASGQSVGKILLKP